MNLITKETEKMFRKIGSQEKVADPMVVVKFFNSCGPGKWFATEMFYEVMQAGRFGEEPHYLEVEASKWDGTIGGTVVDTLFFGYVSIHGDHCDEWGYFSLNELQNMRLLFGLEIERDHYFQPQPISKVCPEVLERLF